MYRKENAGKADMAGKSGSVPAFRPMLDNVYTVSKPSFGPLPPPGPLLSALQWPPPVLWVTRLSDFHCATTLSFECVEFRVSVCHISIFLSTNSLFLCKHPQNRSHRRRQQLGHHDQVSRGLPFIVDNWQSCPQSPARRDTSAS